MKGPRPTTSTSNAATVGATPLLPTRFLRTLNTWKASGTRVLASTKYAEYDVVAGDDDPALDQLMSPEPTTGLADDQPTFACRLTAPASTKATSDDVMPLSEPATPTSGVFDVLLQKDANGLGFCLAVDDRTHEALIVTSFRRLHAGDIGPAEASKSIYPGDALMAINGEPVYSLQQVQSKIAACDESAFLLLRFRRGAPDEAVCPARPAPSTVTRPQHTTMSQRELQMAMTLHDMAMKNELLLAQLSEANMKATTQTREIDALRAEVMQLRLDRDMQAQSASRGWTHGLTRPATKAAAKQELDLVVTEAHNELKRSALQHLQVEKEAIRADSVRQMEQWKASVLKKQVMLEEALLFMVDHVDEWASQPKKDMTPTASPINLASSAASTNAASRDDAKLSEIRAILNKYYASRPTGHVDVSMPSLVQSPPTAATASLA